MTPNSLEDRSDWRRALPALLLVWAPCALLLTWSEQSASSLWFWWALVAAPAGVLAASGPRWTPCVVPLIWILAALVSAGESSPSLPAAHGAAAACTALLVLGYVVGRLLGASRRAASWAGAGLLWVVGGLLTALPSGAGLLVRPWPPAATAALLDLSPQVWVFEVGGFDWLRHPAVYERAGAADLGPDLRVPWSGASAYLALVAALALAGVVGVVGRRRGPNT